MNTTPKSQRLLCLIIKQKIMPDTSIDHNSPWWKHGFVWLVIAGPLLVVIAGFVTFYLAASRPNEIVTEANQPHRTQLNKPQPSQTSSLGDAPAMVGRNHAATGVIPADK